MSTLSRNGGADGTYSGRRVPGHECHAVRTAQAAGGREGPLYRRGDDDQSIYGWRGATLDNLKKLPVDFPHLKVIKLEQNYRSTSAILRAANNVIGPNPKLFPKTLFSELGEGEPVRVVDADNEEHEAERAVAASKACGPRRPGADRAQLHRNSKTLPYCTAPTTRQTVREGVAQGQYPTRCPGGQSFFERAEIRDLCAWFRLWANEDDDPLPCAP